MCLGPLRIKIRAELYGGDVRFIMEATPQVWNKLISESCSLHDHCDVIARMKKALERFSVTSIEV